MLVEIDKIARWLQHDVECFANDLDYLDKTPCTCGLHEFYSPKNRKSTEITSEYFNRPEISYRNHRYSGSYQPSIRDANPDRFAS